MKRLLLWSILLPLFALGLATAWGWWWVGQPLGMAANVSAEQPLALNIEPGTSARGTAEAVVRAGVQTSPELLFAWFRLSGQARSIKAGSYDIEPGATPRSLLTKFVRGEQALRSLTLLEGWNVREVIQAVRRSPHLTQDIEGLGHAEIMALIGYPGVHPEGRFFPDTYRVARNAPASSVLKQAAKAMEQRLAEAWAQRAPGAMVRTPEEALILASIIEKETGVDSDRALVAGVFNNRLRIGMRLQTDPTVIYGLGERFDGNLRKIDLQTDTRYNTYTRAGLPPTPISMPGMASLMAAVQPAATSALYFVARGDGSSQFSATLSEHNAAVRRYQLR